MKKILCKNFDGKRKLVDPSELTFRPAVYAVIIKNGKVLLSQQWDGYDFPGGGIKRGESIEVALKREAHEETGVKIKVGTLIYASHDFFIGTTSGKYFHSILLYYEGKVVSGIPSAKYLEGDEKRFSTGPEWIDIKNIKKIKFKNVIDSVDLIKKALRKSRNKHA